MSVSTLLQPAVENQTWSALYANSLSVASLTSESTSFTGDLDMKNHNILNIGNILDASITPAVVVTVGGTLVSSIGNYFKMNAVTFAQYQYVVNLTAAAPTITVQVPRTSTWNSVNDIFSVSAYSIPSASPLVITSATSSSSMIQYSMSLPSGTFTAGNTTFTLQWSYN